MSLTVNLYYTGKNGSAQKFAREMEESGLADKIRQEPGNENQPLDDPETILLIDSWTDQAAIDAHHQTVMMQELAKLRDKYNLHMKAERFVSNEMPEGDSKYLRQ